MAQLVGSLPLMPIELLAPDFGQVKPQQLQAWVPGEPSDWSFIYVALPASQKWKKKTKTRNQLKDDVFKRHVVQK